MNFTEYQRRAVQTAIYPPDSKVNYTSLGIVGEIGEVAEKVLDLDDVYAERKVLQMAKHGGKLANQVKKIIRDDDKTITPERQAAIRKEIGGVLWYLAALCYDLDISLDDVATENLEVLADRAERGVIQGDGDDR